MQIAPRGRLGFEVPCTLKLQECPVGWPEVGGAAQEPRDVLGEHVEYLARGVATGDPLGIRRKARQVSVPARGQLAPLHLDDLGGEYRMLVAVGSKQRLPATTRLGAAHANPGLELFP